MPQTYDPLTIYLPGQPAPANGWLVSDWASGQSAITAWSGSHVRTAADGTTVLVLDDALAGAPKPFLGAEIQSDAVATTGTFAWIAEVPDMVDGAVFGMFAYRADHASDPWLEFDFEFVGDDTTQVQFTVHMEDASGHRITNLNKTVVDLGFDAAEGLHSYEVVLTGTGAVFRANGEVLAYFSKADMPGGVWSTGALTSVVDLWAADSSYDEWTGGWTDPGVPLVATVAEASVRPSDLGGAMPLLGTSGADSIQGTAGRDVIDGLERDDTLAGGEGDDRIMGGAGNDTLFLDAGNDWIDGGSGIDWLRVAGSAGASMDLGNAWGAQATDYGTDSIRGIENAAGSAGMDRIWGTKGANTLQSEGGDDWLDGREGADRLLGGAGRDTMAGGGDRDCDVFVIQATAHSPTGAGRDTIQQFVGGIDDIDLSGIDANVRLVGNQAFAWGGIRAAANSAWFAVSATSVILRADATGDGVADLEVQLLGVTGLMVDDLLL